MNQDLTEEKRDAVMSVVRSSFRPEFLNRLDETVMFDALTENLGEIIDLLVAALPVPRCVTGVST